MPPPTRRYFYEIDLNGSLYHDRTRLTDRAFLDFFFRQLRANTTGEEPGYPWYSPCGVEWNFVRASETPIVFDRLHAQSSHDILGFNHTSLTVPFAPEQLRVSEHGALYHPARPAAGRLHTHLVLQLADQIQEEAGNYILTYRGRKNLILPYNGEI